MCFVLIRLPAQSEERRKVRGKLIFAPHKCMVYSILKLGFIKMYQQELEHMHRSCWQQANTSRMCRWLRHQKHKWIREGWADLWNIKPNLFNPGVCKNPIPHHGPLTGPTRVWPLINSFQPHSLLRKSSLPNKSKGATPPTHTHTPNLRYQLSQHDIYFHTLHLTISTCNFHEAGSFSLQFSSICIRSAIHSRH